MLFQLLPLMCPQCLQMKGILQEKVKDVARLVDYYRCNDCQYVWAVEKSAKEPQRLPTIVRRS